MRQKTQNYGNQGLSDKKNPFFGSVPKSHTQISVKNASEKILTLGHLQQKVTIADTWLPVRRKTSVVYWMKVSVSKLLFFYV